MRQQWTQHDEGPAESICQADDPRYQIGRLARNKGSASVTLCGPYDSDWGPRSELTNPEIGGFSFKPVLLDVPGGSQTCSSPSCLCELW